MKYCSKCHILKEDSDFYNRWDKPHLLQSHCKLCIIAKSKEYDQNNIVRKHKRDREYHYKNRIKRIEYSRRYNHKNRKKISEYYKNRYINDIDYRIATNIRNRIRIALKRNSKSDFTVKLIGCSIDELKIYLQSKFKNGMNWDNYGLWQIDHIIPCSKFDLSKEDDQKRCFHYSNLQPLWDYENREKSNNILKEMEVYYR